MSPRRRLALSWDSMAVGKSGRRVPPAEGSRESKRSGISFSG